MTPSRTPLVSRSLRRSPAVLGPLLVRKRRHNSSSSESSSRTVKAVSRRKPPGNRPVAQAPCDKNQDKRAKKRSKLTGLTNFFYVGSRRLQRTAEPLSGGPSNAEIEERRARATNASNVPTKEIMSSSDSEGDDELVEQALQLDPSDSPPIPSEMSTPTGSCDVSAANPVSCTAAAGGIVPSYPVLSLAGSIPTRIEHQFYASDYEAPDIATPTYNDEEVIATPIVLKEKEWLGISQAGGSGHQSRDEDMDQDTDETDGPGWDIDSNADDSDADNNNAGNSSAVDKNTIDSNSDDSSTDDSNSDDRNTEDSDTEMFDINDGDSDIGDDAEASGDNAGADDLADSETDGTDVMLGSRASSPEATDHKKHLLSLVRNSCLKVFPETETYKAKAIKYIQKQPQNSPCTKGDVQTFLKQILRSAHAECGSPTSRGDRTGHKAGRGRKVKSLLPGHQSHDHLEMKMEVRKFTMTLLKRKNKQSPFCLPSRKELARFEKRMKGGPTSKNFRVQLTGSLACWWNRRAADVFSRAYIKKYKSRFKHEDLVACFRTHLRTLKNQHERIEAGPTKTQMDLERCSTSARRTRRQGLARRRGEVLEAYEELQEIAPHLNKLTVDGMSGDESDHSGGHRRYVVRKPNWRSDEVTLVLRMLDALALVSHWTSDGRPRPGKFPHVRIISDKVENRDPVRNLPSNFYAKDWLDQLDQYERRELNIRKPVNLVLPNRLLRLANRYKDASDPQRPPLPSGGTQNSASGSRDVRPSGQRRHSGPSNAKSGRALKTTFKKSNRNGMDIDD